MTNVLDLRPGDRLRGDATVVSRPMVIGRSPIPERIGKVALTIRYKHAKTKRTLIVSPEKNFEVLT